MKNLDGSGNNRNYNIGKICSITVDVDDSRNLIVCSIHATKERYTVEEINYHFPKEEFDEMMKIADVSQEESLIGRYVIIGQKERNVIVPSVNFINWNPEDTHLWSSGTTCLKNSFKPLFKQMFHKISLNSK
ncbi:MAG: hypothetical protein K2H53_06480 [Clostridia bacterium]|nr:hypothetical protein [Clostridia bacterium]